jgi:hypothetical protein
MKSGTPEPTFQDLLPAETLRHAVKLQYGSTQDTIIANDGSVITVDGITTNAETLFMRVENSRVSYFYAKKASQLSYQGVTYLNQANRVTGKITGLGVVVTTSTLPPTTTTIPPSTTTTIPPQTTTTTIHPTTTTSSTTTTTTLASTTTTQPQATTTTTLHIAECSSNQQCYDKHQSCYYQCIGGECAQIQTLVALPEYPDCGQQPTTTTTLSQTPCNYNTVCETTLGETVMNCQDCLQQQETGTDTTTLIISFIAGISVAGAIYFIFIRK